VFLGVYIDAGSLGVRHVAIGEALKFGADKIGRYRLCREDELYNKE
jgi:hypothetical protein